MKQFKYFLLLMVWLQQGVSCRSQPSSVFAPEPGVYAGNTLNSTATMNYSYNPITGFGIQPSVSTTPGINLLGDMNISSTAANKGSYQFSKLKDWKGTWQYDPVKDVLTCTGPLKDALQYYHAGKGYYQFTLLVKAKPADAGGVTYYFSKKAGKTFPKRTRPNGELTGIFTVKPDANSVAFLDAATATIEKTFSGKAAFTNYNHSSIAVGFTDNTHYYEINITEPGGKIIRYSPADIMAFNWKFQDYKYGILNYDGQRMALLGKTPDNFDNLTYTAGEYVAAVFDRSGRQLGAFPIEYNRYVIPSFLPDGRLLYCPKSGGLALTDANYKSSTTIFSRPVNAMTVSPDGSRIFFSEGKYFYSMNANGSNIHPVLCDGEKLEVANGDDVITMAWSPAGKEVAICYKSRAKYSILIVPLDGSSYRFVKDEYGEIYEHAGEIISWH